MVLGIIFRLIKFKKNSFIVKFLLEIIFRFTIQSRILSNADQSDNQIII